MKNDFYSKLVANTINPKGFGKKDDFASLKKAVDTQLLQGGDMEEKVEIALQSLFAQLNAEPNDASNAFVKNMMKMTTEKGISTTNEYREIYFNEIIQNANDLQSEGMNEEIQVETKVEVLEQGEDPEKEYSISFIYSDDGFTSSNLVGFMEMEISAKAKKETATGKHGVGIKCLLNFAHTMKIESNVNIIIHNTYKGTVEEEDAWELSTALHINEKWYDQTEKTTRFTLVFSNKYPNYQKFELGKLMSLMELISASSSVPSVELKTITPFFLSLEQEKLVFDLRNLIFTDGHIGKEQGIKKISFNNGKVILTATSQGREVVELPKDFRGESCCYWVERVTLSCSVGEESKERHYLVFTNKTQGAEKPFSMAFPVEGKDEFTGTERYYETFFIPDEGSYYGVNVLINSGHSNVSRTKLPERNKERIYQEIENNMANVYRVMASKEVGESPLGEVVSRVFHQALLFYAESPNFKIPYKTNDKTIDTLFDPLMLGLNNEYLPLVEGNETASGEKKILIYQRKEKGKEEFEKIHPQGERDLPKRVKKFFQKFVERGMCIPYSEIKPSLLTEVATVYETALANATEPGYRLSRSLNLFHCVRDLIYAQLRTQLEEDGFWREKSEEEIDFSDEFVDAWHGVLYDRINDGAKDLSEVLKEMTASFALMSWYKLNLNIAGDGTIRGANLLGYLLRDKENQSTEQQINPPYPTMKAKGVELYDERYGELRKEVTKITVEGYYNDHHRGVFDWMKVNGNETIETLSWDSKKCLLEWLGKSKQKVWEAKDCLLLQYSDIIGKKEGGKTYDKKRVVTGVKVDFLKNVETSSWEEFVTYANTISALGHGNVRGKFKGTTICVGVKGLTVSLQSLQGVQLSVEKLPELQKFFSEIHGSENHPKTVLQVKLEGEIEKTTSPEMLKFIKDSTGLDCHVIRESREKSGKMLLAYKKQFFLAKSGKMETIGSYVRVSEDNELIIVSGDQKKNEQAILADALGIVLKESNPNFVEIFKSYVNTGKIRAVNIQEYKKELPLEMDFSRESPREVAKIEISSMNATTWLKLLRARGNQDKCCAFCGARTEEIKESQLVVMSNENSETKEKYPQLFLATCKECEKVIKSSLKEVVFYHNDENDGENVIEIQRHITVGGQSKEETHRIFVSEGMRSLYQRDETDHPAG